MPSTRPKQINHSQKGKGIMSAFTKSGDYFMKEELTEMWDKINKKYETNTKLPSSSVW